jgi:hypothetical protein
VLPDQVGCNPDATPRQHLCRIITTEQKLLPSAQANEKVKQHDCIRRFMVPLELSLHQQSFYGGSTVRFHH